MAKALLASPHRSDYATITAGSQAPAMPASNLFRMQPSDVWRAVDLSQAYLTIDRTDCADGGPRLLALLYHNGSATGTLRVRAGASEAEILSSPALDMTVPLWADPNHAAWERRHTFVWLGDAQRDHAVWRIDIADPDNPAGYFQAGRLYLCNPYVPGLNIKFGWSIGWVDPSGLDTTLSGASFPAERAVRRQLRFTLIAAGDNARAEFFDNLFAINRYRGAKADVLVLIDRDQAARLMDWSVYGLMTDLSPIQNDYAALYEQPYLITEIEAP